MRERNSHERFMSPELFDASLDYLERSGIGEARLLGGEPTLHPQFAALVDSALKRGLRLLIFTGGVIPERALDKLASLPESSVRLLMNVALPGSGAEYVSARQHEVYTRLGQRVVLGVTIESPAVSLESLLELIDRFGLAHTVRLGLAHPTLGGDNEYLHARYYAEVGRRVADFAFRARHAGVAIEFDCGWVPCMFPPGTMEELGFSYEQVGLRCNPILDVLADGQVISCYPLSSHHREPLLPDRDAGWFRDRFLARQRTDRTFTLFRECETCDWRARGQCTGGCLSGSLRRLRRREPAIPVVEAV